MFQLCVPEDPPCDSLNLRSNSLSSSTAVKSKLGRSVVQGLARTLDPGCFLWPSSLLVNRGKKFESCVIAFMQTKASWATNKILYLSLFLRKIILEKFGNHFCRCCRWRFFDQWSHKRKVRHRQHWQLPKLEQSGWKKSLFCRLPRITFPHEIWEAMLSLTSHEPRFYSGHWEKIAKLTQKPGCNIWSNLKLFGPIFQYEKKAC